MYANIFKGGGNPFHDAKGLFSAAPSSAAAAEADPVVPNFTRKQIAASLERLNRRGITVKVNAEDWMAATNGAMDPEEFVQTIWSKESYTKGLINAELSHSEDSGAMTLSGNGTMYGSKVEYCERQLNMHSNQIEHTYLKLEPGEVGTGMVKAMFAEALPFYKRSGIKEVTTHANLDAGAYAWGKFGFTTTNPAMFKNEFEQGWKAVVKARASEEFKQPLSKEAQREIDDIRDAVEKMKDDPRITTVITAMKTPALDKELGHLYKGLTPLTPDAVERTFVKTALYGKHWFGRLDLSDNTSMAMVSDYLLPKKKPKK